VKSFCPFGFEKKLEFKIFLLEEKQRYPTCAMPSKLGTTAMSGCDCLESPLGIKTWSVRVLGMGFFY